MTIIPACAIAAPVICRMQREKVEREAAAKEQRERNAEYASFLDTLYSHQDSEEGESNHD